MFTELEIKRITHKTISAFDESFLPSGIHAQQQRGKGFVDRKREFVEN